MRFLIIAFLVFISSESIPQTSTYHPMPDSNASWNVWWYDVDCDLINTYWERFSYVISGDTVINSFNYHIISKPYIQVTGCSLSMGPSVNYNHEGFIGFIRQDTINKMVYIIPRNSSTEQILYNFNLHVNDSLIGYANHDCLWTKTILSIDSFLVGANYRKRWNLSGYSIIEGIGSTLGLLDFCNYTLSPSNHLGCFSENGQILFNDGMLPTCETITSLDKTFPEATSGRIFPNPFHSRAVFESTNIQKTSVLNIYDVYGDCVRSQKINSEREELFKENLPIGIYFYQLTSDGNKQASGKFIIE